MPIDTAAADGVYRSVHWLRLTNPVGRDRRVKLQQQETVIEYTLLRKEKKNWHLVAEHCLKNKGKLGNIVTLRFYRIREHMKIARITRGLRIDCM